MIEWGDTSSLKMFRNKDKKIHKVIPMPKKSQKQLWYNQMEACSKLQPVKEYIYQCVLS